MKIAQALKQKKVLVGEIEQVWNKLLTSNSISEGNTRTYSPKQLKNEIASKTTELVALKLALYNANKPIQEKIFLRDELKTQAQKIKCLNTTSGVNYGYGNTKENAVKYEAEISELEKDAMIKAYEDQINKIQDELETFNHTTDI